MTLHSTDIHFITSRLYSWDGGDIAGKVKEEKTISGPSARVPTCIMFLNHSKLLVVFLCTVKPVLFMSNQS